MLRKTLCALAVPALCAGSAAQAAERADLGKQEYLAKCILCHGAEGKGGAYVDMLSKTPPDLTQIAKRNGGIFPVARIYEVIDGRTELKAHGTREMPIWGKEYQMKAAEHYVDMPYDPEAYIRVRVLSLIDYLYRLQAK